jgi:hypothetical protein
LIDKNMPNWFYEDKEVVEEYQFDEKAVGFVYMITNIETGKFYIGRKVFTNTLTKKLTKKEISEQSGPGRKPTKKKVVKESNWREYWGSCKPLLAEVKEIGEDKFKREILKLCYTKKQITYYEIAYQCKYDVLEVNSYNDNIMSRIFRKDLLLSE